MVEVSDFQRLLFCLSGLVFLISLAACVSTPSKPELPELTRQNFHEHLEGVESFSITYYPVERSEPREYTYPNEQEFADLMAGYRKVLTDFGLREDGGGELLELGINFEFIYWDRGGIELRNEVVFLLREKKKRLQTGIRGSFSDEVVIRYRNSLQKKKELMHRKRRERILEDMPNHFCALISDLFPNRAFGKCDEPVTKAGQLNWRY